MAIKCNILLIKPIQIPLIHGQELAETVASLAWQKKAEEIVILDLRGLSNITDYFVICSGTSKPHLKAIRSEVKTRLREDRGVSAKAADGEPESQWMVLDYGDVIVHVFHRHRRDYFALEDLWSDAPRIEWAPEPVPA
jgi:ribosome-associated protein